VGTAGGAGAPVAFTPVEPLTMAEGWGVLHLFERVDRSGVGPDAAKRLVAAADELEADGHQLIACSILGHKADVGFMALGPDLARLHAFQAEVRACGALQPAWSYVSLTESSEYTTTEDDERARLEAEGLAAAEVDERLVAWRDRMAHYLEHRVHPQLPAKRSMCFYPMSKLRVPGANWFELPFAERKQLMGGHAKTGRGYAGRVLQLITGSAGLDDWEWGVTLLADDPADLKRIVYEMRFDAASARYADFGPFVTGLVGPLPEVLASVGVDGGR
jgi:hydrogen peroxide-dependent heme synthase